MTPRPLTELTKLLAGSREGVLPSTQLFPPVDLEQLAAELRVAQRGTEDGVANLPSQDGCNETAAESDIRTEIQRRSAAARRDYELQIDLYEARIRRGLLGADLRASIESAAQTALSDFRVQVTDDIGHLDALREEFEEYEREYREFRRDNELSRPHRNPNQLLRWLFVLFAVTVETAANGFFFAKGSALGLIGGVGQALVFSALNAGLALWSGLIALPRLIHTKPRVKVLGWTGACAYLLLMVVLNLAIGQFRDLYIVNEGSVPLETWKARMLDAPVDLADAESVVLVVVGMALSLLVAADARGLRDPYLGYGKIGRLRDDAWERYRDQRSAYLEQLTARRDQALSDMSQVLGDTRAKEQDVELALAGRDRLREQHEGFRQHLGDVFLGLHQRYREANHRTRTQPPPSGFATLPVLPTFAPIPVYSDVSVDRQSVHKVIDRMEQFIRDLNREYESQAKRYSTPEATSMGSTPGVSVG